MAADFNSGVWDVSGMTAGSIEIAWASFANVGAQASIKIQTSNSGVCWCDYPNSSIDVDDATGCKMYDFTSIEGVLKMRIVYTAGGASAGTMSAITVAKLLMDNGIVGGNQ